MYDGSAVWVWWSQFGGGWGVDRGNLADLGQEGTLSKRLLFSLKAAMSSKISNGVQEEFR